MDKYSDGEMKCQWPKYDHLCITNPLDNCAEGLICDVSLSSILGGISISGKCRVDIDFNCHNITAKCTAGHVCDMTKMPNQDETGMTGRCSISNN